MIEVVIGIDIGGTFTKFGIIDRKGNQLGEGSIPTDKRDNVLDYMSDLHHAISLLLEKGAGNYDLKGIGVGAPNGNYYKGTIENAVNLKWTGNIEFCKEFGKFFPVPVVLTNDANAAAIGEMIFGAAKGMRDFIVITLGTGLGSGLVANGELIYGHDGFAGELGHTIAKPGGRMCGCGRRGCLETYVSATGIKRTVYKLLADTTYPSELRKYSFEQLTPDMISCFANTGDPVALQSFDYTAQFLGMKLAEAVAHTSPEAIFLFGGLSKAGDLLFVPTRKYFEENLLGIYRNKIKILPSGLTDKNAAVMGASALIWKELDKKA
ncbi:MAG: ROK family protein [Bacteroidales bacterium]